jgi:imidazolonepropionase
MPVLDDIRSLVTPVPGARQGVLRIVDDAAVAWQDGRIAWVGPRAQLPGDFDDGVRHSAGGGLVVPGLIDCHTHLAFAGWRAAEFEQRILGRSYLEIARAGGGIQSTVALTRAASEDALLERCVGHAQGIAALGVTTLECKSGYGLDVEHELKLLRVYRRLAAAQPLRIVATLLGAHTVPAEYRDRREAYIALVRERMIPEAAQAGLARFCDVFVEDTAFGIGEARAIFRTAAAYGLRAKVHADQLSDTGGASLAADVRAVSADHLEHVSPAGIEAMSAAGTVAVSLPIATLYLRQPPMPARALLDAGVPVAVATDFNPGTAPSYHLPLAMMLACTLQRMTPSEVLAGATLVAAAALGLEGEIGALEPGFSADLAILDVPDVDHWLYHFRPNVCRAAFARGAVTSGAVAVTPP